MNKAQQAFEKERRGVPPAPVSPSKPGTMLSKPEADGADFDLLKNAIESLQTRCASLENRLSTLEKRHDDVMEAAVEKLEADHA